MNKMISVAPGFQYSVNISFDLNNKEKIRNFIPTAASLSLLEEILLSTSTTSSERARILIGAYGKGKSHIMMMILSLLMKRDLSLFSHVLSDIKGSRLDQIIQSYYESNRKILPVVVSGSSTSLTQAFLLALQRTLSSYGFTDVMPETNYEAAIATIRRWEKEFPDTYEKFGQLISMPIESFISQLSAFDISVYGEFERVYSQITSGSVFNPFLGFDVVELYENVAKGLKTKGFSGLFVVYDEFSKYLEANIKEASISDTKMLQDFAEKCNRSGETQMHIMLISHKEIANYIDVLPKQKVDGWRGVSERFLHVRLSNNFTQTYEIIESVIRKDKKRWGLFQSKFEGLFDAIEKRYKVHSIFAGMNAKDVKRIVRGCYPLHPVSTFILPRLSEQVAQNERTLFTFLSAEGKHTLPGYLENADEQSFRLITPDRVYDYFEPLLRKEIYNGTLHEVYRLTELILGAINGETLESRIVKTISLIYILEQFDKLQPTEEELVGVFSVEYSPEEISVAIRNLIEKKYVVYLKRSNGFLQLKQSSGVDFRQCISDVVERERDAFTVEEALNEVNSESYMFPARYNDEHEMIRFFSFLFVNSKSIVDDWKINNIINSELADGVIVGIVPQIDEPINELRKRVELVSTKFENTFFVLPNTNRDIAQYVREYKAVIRLRDQAEGDRILFDEYETVYEDLRDLIVAFITSYVRPEQYQATYFLAGKKVNLNRRAALSEELSKICDRIYALTPVINCEALNRTDATAMARTSRNKVVSALLRTELEPNLGLTGTGQEVSIMRSTLVRTGIIEELDGNIHLNHRPENNPLIAQMLEKIESFFLEARENGKVSFEVLYEKLLAAKNRIALRKELVPIYLAVIMHKYRKQIVISDIDGQLTTTAENLMKINAAPEKYWIEYLDWDADKAEFVKRMEMLFSSYIVEIEKCSGPYDYIITAMKRWFMSLPKYSKEMRVLPSGEKINQGYYEFQELLKRNPVGYSFLYDSLPKAFGYSGFVLSVVDNIIAAKNFFDEAIEVLRNQLIIKTKTLFAPATDDTQLVFMSLASVVKDWCERQDPSLFEQIFADGTEKCLILLRSITNDERTFAARLAKAMTDLRIEDWNDGTLLKCIERVKQCKTTAEAFKPLKPVDSGDTCAYQITFALEGGGTEVRRFERIDTSARAKLLLNKIMADIDSFGQAITEAEKRQIIVDVLKKLC